MLLVMSRMTAGKMGLEEGRRIGDWEVRVFDPDRLETLRAMADLAARRGDRVMAVGVYLPPADVGTPVASAAAGRIGEVANEVASLSAKHRLSIRLFGVHDGVPPAYVAIAMIPADVGELERFLREIQPPAGSTPPPSRSTLRLAGEAAPKPEKPREEEGPAPERAPEPSPPRQGLRLRLGSRPDHPPAKTPAPAKAPEGSERSVPPAPARRPSLPAFRMPAFRMPAAAQPAPPDVAEVVLWMIRLGLGLVGAGFLYWLAWGGGAQAIEVFIRYALRF